MTQILYITASPRGEMSQSGKLAEAYLAARQSAQPDVTIDRLDLWRADLPEFDGDKAAAKMTFFGVGDMDGPRQSAWDQVVAVTNRFTQADEYVLSVPMWNGGIPYKLKQYIDIITQPGLLFGFDPEAGYSGLLSGKSARVFYTSGVYAPGAPAKYGTDHHSTYLDWWLDFIGVTEIETVRFQPSLLTADPDGDQLQALERAADLNLQNA
ncbi:NAD(P)H-dependent oxidoreductase [Sulfitobacter sp. G21635-S1]|uniref:FMN-dependent NADH-azoreductase n=1 Tax=Sulfitobacter sp. G21635-S1 TaxID=3014043 RepID=UPI0022B01C68|nr:NAD(P)H-dependent oxidoreductase [Sulfitobacter sp. G21635-S1]MCZ4255496.1 NAD(P)H-dependent oxidoreductase [Sulfitobacter sp. G21635-S1]